MIVGSELGIGYDPGQHAAYAASWVSILKDQPLEIFRAAADAEKIQSYLFTLRQHQTLPDPISEYNASVDGPEARSKLEKENPAASCDTGCSNNSTKKGATPKRDRG